MRPKGSTGLPLAGWDVRVLDNAGTEAEANTEGNIAIKLPLPPGALTTVYNNDKLYVSAYLEQYPGFYATSDVGYKDVRGNITILGRSDDVINVSGHRLSTGQLEEVVSGHKDVVECACLGSRNALKGEVPIALVVSLSLSLGLRFRGIFLYTVGILCNVISALNSSGVLQSCSITPLA